MRRLKQDVLKELPNKIIQDYVCEMTPIQKELYAYWDKIYKGKEGDKETKVNPKNKTAIISNNNNSLKIIDSLRKVCNYPGLLLKDEKLTDTPQFKKIKKETLLNFNSSGKFKALEELLTSLNFISNKENTIDTSLNSTNPGNNSNGLIKNLNNVVGNSQIADTTFDNKVLIFTQFKTMVDKIYEMLNEKFSSLKVLKITSDLPNEERINSVSRFNSDPYINILILTTSIGGLGLSLTSANIVIMFDHDWNPMKDLQAMDRAHRIGQKKTVEVFRLITADSIEEKLISLQTFKKYIANNIVDQTKIHETKINTNSFMESLEEFSNNCKSSDKVKKSNLSNKNIKNKFDLDNQKFDNDMIEIEYLNRLLEEKK
jgi:TATA-binding protein-associated factor